MLMMDLRFHSPSHFHFLCGASFGPFSLIVGDPPRYFVAFVSFHVSFDVSYHDPDLPPSVELCSMVSLESRVLPGQENFQLCLSPYLRVRRCCRPNRWGLPMGDAVHLILFQPLAALPVTVYFLFLEDFGSPAPVAFSASSGSWVSHLSQHAQIRYLAPAGFLA